MLYQDTIQLQKLSCNQLKRYYSLLMLYTKTFDIYSISRILIYLGNSYRMDPVKYPTSKLSCSQ